MDLVPDTVTSLFQAIAESVGSFNLGSWNIGTLNPGSRSLFGDDGPDGRLGVLMSGLAGMAAALAVALLLAVYFRSGYRSARDMIRHGLAAAAVLGLLAFAAYDMRHAALDYLGINPSKPQAGFEIERALASASAESRIAEAT
jgi:hypothetical protein